MFDRSKYKSAKTSDLKAEEKKVHDITQSYQGNRKWISLDEGLNKLRIFPAHPGTEANIFYSTQMCTLD